MPRGGHRNGAGGTSTWKHGRTKTIRVPIELADEIIKIARDLDDGKKFVPREEVISEPVTGSKVLDLSGIAVRQVNGVIAVYLEDLVKVGYQLLPQNLSLMVNARIRKRYNQ